MESLEPVSEPGIEGLTKERAKTLAKLLIEEIKKLPSDARNVIISELQKLSSE